MRMITILIFVVTIMVSMGCRPAAAPVAVSDRPVSVNGVPQSNVPLPPSKPIPEMEWTTLEGNVGKIAAFRGKAVILDFWATYCGPCRQEIPHLNELLAKHGADNLLIVGLNVGGEEDLLKIPEFVKETKIDYEIAVPEDALNRYIFAESSSIPQTAVFDRQGRLVQKFIGYNAAIKAELDKAVETAVNRN